jgi:hypothetical protein
MLIPAVIGSKGEPLDLGRQRRLISTPLRRALYLRDRGCAFPGVRHEALSTNVEVKDLHHCYVAS